MNSIRRTTLLSVAGALVFLPLLATEAISQDAIQTPVIASGGGEMGGGGSELFATIGQPFAPEETLAGVDNETVWVGFWSVLPSDPSSVREEQMASAAGTTRIAAIAPNPFTDRLSLEIGLASGGHVIVAVHDGLGREVARLVDGERPLGSHRITWRPDGLPAGAYLVRLEVDGVVRGSAPIQHYR
jgi:hypothetical protein